MLKAFLQELDSAPEVAKALLECILPSIQTGTTHTSLIRRLAMPETNIEERFANTRQDTETTTVWKEGKEYS